MKFALSLVSIAILLMGIILNILSAVVFWRSPVTVSNTFMISMISLECTCLLLTLPICVADMLYQVHEPAPLPLAYYRLASELTFFVIARRTIIIVTAIIATDRFLTSSFPFTTRGKALIKRPKLTVSLIFAGVFVYSTVEVVLRWQVIEVVDTESNSTEGIIIPSEKFRTNIELLYFFITTNVLFQYMPAIILASANTGLLLFLSRHQRLMRQKQVRRIATEAARTDPTQSVSVILAYSVVTMMLHLPLEIYMSRDVISQLENWSGGLLVEPPDMGLIPAVYSFVNVLGWSVDFLIYFAVSSNFRAAARKLMGVREGAAFSQQTRSTQPSV